jgi:hypothetical protein
LQAGSANMISAIALKVQSNVNYNTRVSDDYRFLRIIYKLDTRDS